MIPSLKRASAQFIRNPFLFAWSSFMYVVLQLLFASAAVGLFIMYFFVASLIGVPVAANSIPTIIAAVATLFVLLFFSCGLNAGLLRSYAAALEGRKTTVAEFLRHSLKKAAAMFAIMLITDLLLALFVGPAVLLYTSSLKDMAYMDLVVGAYVLGVLFLVSFLFTPAYVSIGAFGMDFVTSLRNGILFLRRKHVNALGLYVVFACAWLLNLVPLVDIATIFVVYPVAYSALIVMFQGSGSVHSR